MALYGIFSFLDYAIYSMVKYVVRLIILIANADFFKENTIREVASKVYVVLGVLVLFKIVISCIQYMVNPDTFDDKDKGMAGILKKAVISMALLAVVQPVFKFALEMQSTIVSTIPSIVLGNSSERVTIKDNNSQTFRDSLDKISDQVAGTTIWSFVTPKKDRNVTNGTTVDEFQQKITLGCDGSIWALFDTNKCDYEYRIGISTAAGIFLLYVLVSMTLDVGIRTIKFGILQILAPIPISSYIVSKDKLNKFVKLSTKVYLDLFVRLGVIYFIIFFIQKVIESIGDAGNIIAGGAYQPEPLEQSFIKVVIIVALFMFAKNAPKFICEVLGIDGGGFGDLKDMFTRGGGMAGAALNPISNAVSNFRKSRQNGEKNVATNLRRAFAGAGRGVVDSLAGLAAGDNWQKMRARHDKAVQKSSARSLAHANRMKNKDQSADKKNALTRLKENLENRRKSFVTDADNQQAQANLTQRKNELNQLADEIKTMAPGAERDAKIREYRDKSLAISNESQFLKDEAVRVAAQRQVNAKTEPYKDQIKNANDEITRINQQLSTETDAKKIAELESKKLGLQQDISKAQGEIENITHENAKNTAKNELNAATVNRQNVETRVNGEISRITASSNAAATDITNAQTAIETNNQRITAIDAELATVAKGSTRERELAKERQELVSNNTIQAGIIRTKTSEVQGYETTISNLNAEKTAAINAEREANTKFEHIQNEANTEIQKLIDEYNGFDDQIKSYQGEIDKIDVSEKAAKASIRASRFSNFDSYWGGATPSGKGYLDLSSFLGSSRSSIYTGEAMTKMRQNANILVQEDGSPVTYQSKYCNIPGREYSYDEMRSLLNDVQTSKISIETLQKEYGFSSSAVLQSAFEEVEKYAARDYINANIALVDEKVRDKVHVRLRPGEKANSAVIEWFDDFAADLYKNGASKKDLDALFAEFKDNPGKFIAGASEKKDKYSSIGKKIVDAQKPSDGGKK